MKRVMLPFLVLGGLALLWVVLRADTPAADTSSNPRDDAGGSESRRAPAERESRAGAQTSGSLRRPNEALREAPRDEARPSAPQTPGELIDDDLAGTTPPAAGDEATEEAAEERAPLKRYADDDALALRRGRQIELVTQAQSQAREALEAAEGRGDTASAAQTRGVLRRLELRLSALEAAASAPVPY